MKSSLLICVALLLFASCKQKSTSTDSVASIDINPASAGFNLEASDATAIAWADATMQAMGGRDNWDNLHFVSWNFFGARDLVWDKWTGRVRIDFPSDSSISLVNVNTLEGSVWRNGQKITQPDSLKKYLNRAKSIWINDSYWLVMPFKLKDSGVTLKHLRQDTTQVGSPAEVLQLTFENVGDTPHNKYEVFIDKSDSLIKQWAFFKDASQDTASAIWPWDNYKDYDGLLLSGDRSDNRGPKNVKVYDALPDAVFEAFDPFALK